MSSSAIRCSGKGAGEEVDAGWGGLRARAPVSALQTHEAARARRWRAPHGQLVDDGNGRQARALAGSPVRVTPERPCPARADAFFDAGIELLVLGLRSRFDGPGLTPALTTYIVRNCRSSSEGVADDRRPCRRRVRPPSLHASLMARLDRLGAAKEIAQIGAAIRREFSHALLAAVVRKPEPELGPALDRIVRAGLLFPSGRTSSCELSL